MKKIYLFTITLFAVGLMLFSPVTVEASASFGEPTEEACASCHKVAETMLADGTDVSTSEMGTVLGFVEKGGAAQVALGVSVERPDMAPDTRIVYAEETPSYRIIDYGKSFSTGSTKVPI